MFSKINRMEALLTKLAASLEATETKRYTANQSFRAENINLAEGSTLNIHMNNTILSMDVVNECLEIISGLKCLLPVAGQTGLKAALNHYENILMVKALDENGHRKDLAAEKLGLNERQVRYWCGKNRHKIPALPEPEESIDE